jgi:hypothetical protein
MLELTFLFHIFSRDQRQSWPRLPAKVWLNARQEFPPGEQKTNMVWS